MNATKTRRRNPFRPLLYTAGAIVVLGVAGTVVLASALDPQKLRDELQDAVLRSTGRTLIVNGGVHLRFGLSPQFEVDGIALSNIEGGSRPTMLTAKSLRATLALFPLLGGDAVISALSLQDPDLLLERTADGTPNWQFAGARRALYQGHSSASTGGGRHRVQIRSIDLQGGTLTWQPSQGERRVFGITNASASAESDDTPVNYAFDGTYQGVAGPVPFSLTGNSGSLARLQGGPVSALAGPWPVNLQAHMQGVDLKVEGGISHPDQARSYTFRLTGHADDLGALNAFLAKPVLPPLADVNVNGVIADDSEGNPRTSQVSIHAENTDLSKLVPGLLIKQATLSAPGPGQLVQLNVDGSYSEQPLHLAAAVMQPDVMASSAPLQLTIGFQAAGATLSAHGTVPPGMNASGLDVQVDGRAPDLSTLSPLVGQSLPPAHDVSLSAEVQDAGVKLRGVTVHNLNLESSLGDLTGDLTVNWSPRHAITGTLSSRRLDLDAAASGTAGDGLPQIWPPPQNSAPPVQPMAAPAATAPTPPSVAPLPGQAPFSLPLVFLRDNDADVSFSVGDLAVGGQHYQDLAAHLQLQDGKLTLNPFRAQAPEGALIGGVSIDATTDMSPVAVTLRSPSISAASVAGLLGHPGDATGVMQVDAQLSGIGQTLPALEASLNGHLGLAMVNGTFSDSLVQALIGDALQASGVPSLGGGTSQVNCLALRINFNGGQGAIQTLAADTSRVSLSGDGMLDLAAGTASLHLRPRIHLGPTEVSAPVSVQGPFGAMKASLDPVMGNGRVGIEIGGGGGSGCIDRLASVRNGLGGPVPQAAPANDPRLNIKIKKPRDLLQGLFH
jgi:AsmA protein